MERRCQVREFLSAASDRSLRRTGTQSGLLLATGEALAAASLAARGNIYVAVCVGMCVCSCSASMLKIQILFFSFFASVEPLLPQTFLPLNRDVA